MVYTQLSTWTVTAKPPKSDTKWYQANAAASAFHAVQIDDEAFAKALQQGHAFRAAGSKSDTATTNVIAYDFDTTDTRLIDRLASLIDHPLIWYSSYSDSPQKPRYRLIFKLSRTITAAEYPTVYEGIAKRNRFWAEIDRRPYCQFYFSGRSIRYNPNQTEINPDRYLIQQQPLTATTTETAADPQPNRPAKPSSKPRKASSKPTTADPDLERFIASFGALQPAAAADKGGAHETEERGDLYYIVSTPLPAVTEADPVIYTPAGYLHTPERTIWDNERKKRVLARFRDGEKRHRIIYLTALILRHLNPELAPLEHAQATLLETLKTIDYGDGKYTAEAVIRIAYKAYNADTKKELTTRQHIAKYRVNQLYCDTTGETKKQVCGRTNAKSRKAKNYEVFLAHYDPRKSDRENLLRLAKKGISRPTYFRYKDEYQNTPKTT